MILCCAMKCIRPVTSMGVSSTCEAHSGQHFEPRF